MIEAVLFDMDGILIDSEREYDKAMREAITRYGHIITDEFLLRVRGIPVEAFKKRGIQSFLGSLLFRVFRSGSSVGSFSRVWF